MRLVSFSLHKAKQMEHNVVLSTNAAAARAFVVPRFSLTWEGGDGTGKVVGFSSQQQVPVPRLGDQRRGLTRLQTCKEGDVSVLACHQS